ncbi:hypothetical protein OG301_26805 [Streptomyces platensis]|uniref:hypothetical protein n=1 Tax=Streptomyces platensis TaxID=58346 RepID=UPI002ED39EB5|nr:hypothetical protein OG301_26805 [Streptomyces platensis]
MDITLVHEDGRVWSSTESGFIWHAFRMDEDGHAVALCRKSIRPRTFTKMHDDYKTLEKTHDFALTARCDRCQDKLAALEAPKEPQEWTKKELRAAADEFAATAVKAPADEGAKAVTRATIPEIPAVGRHAMWLGQRVEIASPPILCNQYRDRTAVHYCVVRYSGRQEWALCAHIIPLPDECQTCPLTYDWYKGEHVVKCVCV